MNCPRRCPRIRSRSEGREVLSGNLPVLAIRRRSAEDSRLAESVEERHAVTGTPFAASQPSPSWPSAGGTPPLEPRHDAAVDTGDARRPPPIGNGSCPSPWRRTACRCAPNSASTTRRRSRTTCDLGVTHLYASPYLQAGKGSTHGYDVLDHSQPNAELGGPEAHARLCEALGKANLGQILDIVPNHMSIASPQHNKWWWDVLENGQSSRYAGYFDVDWKPAEAKLRDTVLMPILGDHYGREVEAGHVQTQRGWAAFTFHYFDHVDARRPPVAQRPAQRGRARRSGRTSWPSSPTRSATCRSRPRPTRERQTAASRQGGPPRRPRPALRREARGRLGHRRGRRRINARPMRRSTPSSSARIIAWPSGRPPSRSSTTAGSSTSTP